MEKIIITQKQLNKFEGRLDAAVVDIMVLDEETLHKYEDAKIIENELIILDENAEVVKTIKIEVEENEMKNIMTRAWEIAREGASKFGGKAVEYLSESMKIAWAESREDVKTEIVLAPGSRRHKSWLAKINGSHPQYRLDRQFLNSESEEDKVYNVENGIYEACDGGDRYFIEVTNGEYNIVNDDWVYDNIA